MEPVINNPSLRDLGPGPDGRPRFELLEPLHYILPVGGGGGGIFIEVPIGYVTDFASVPKLLWSIFPPIGEFSRAAIIHDWMYSEAACSRFLADAIFRDLMKDLGTPLWRRVAMYYAVRLFGRGTWK